MRFGHLIEGSGGALIHYSLGARIKERGLGRLRKFLKDSSLDSTLLAEYPRRLEPFRACSEGLAAAYRNEERFMLRHLDPLDTRWYQETFSKVDSRALAAALLRYRGEETRKAFAETFKTLAENASRPYREMKWPDLYVEYRSAGFEGAGPSDPNAVGKIIYFRFVPVLVRPLTFKCRENVSVSATQALFALKSHRVRTGTLPDSLAGLKADGLEKAPVDDFDGRPLRYHPDGGILYSLGEKMDGSGGPPGETNLSMPRFKIDF